MSLIRRELEHIEEPSKGYARSNERTKLGRDPKNTSGNWEERFRKASTGHKNELIQRIHESAVLRSQELFG